MITAEKSRFDTAAEMLGEIGQVLMKMPPSIKNNAVEIRLRTGKPPVVELENERIKGCERIVTAKDISDCITRFCGYSVYSHERELSEGFITLKGGHRAGFCGTSITRHGKTESIGEYSSINLRIAREHIGCADRLYTIIRENRNFKGMLIIGPPLSAKTTILRDIARQLGDKYKVCVLDERSEIAAVSSGIPQNDVGMNTDVLNGFSKKEAFRMALRTMSPEYIICDEIGDEAEQIRDCLCCGVKVILTAHCGSIDEAYSGKFTSEILKTNAISHIVLMNREKLGEIGEIKVVDNENSADSCGVYSEHRNGNLSFFKA